MNKIAITGYYGTGSSAVIDLLTEYKNVCVSVNKRYEHFIFMCKRGLFDLEARLFSENSNYMIRDIAINEFIQEMKMQNDNDFGWYGSYKKLYGDKFSILLNDFVNSISYEMGKNEFAHTKGTRFSLFKVVLQLGAKICTGYKINKLGRVYVYDKSTARYLKVNHCEFLEAAKKFANGYLDLCSCNQKLTIFDHLIFPEEVAVLDKFFDDDMKVIIVDRDPRDVFLSGKYIWSTIGFGKQKMPYANDVDVFCNDWKLVHKNTDGVDSKKILKLQFEDLIYNYEDTKKTILEFCGISCTDKIDGIDNFMPKESIKNTQVFNICDQYLIESREIEKLLEKYIYNFPYKIQTSFKDVFDK